MTEDPSGESGREQKLHAVLAAYYGPSYGTRLYDAD